MADRGAAFVDHRSAAHQSIASIHQGRFGRRDIGQGTDADPAPDGAGRLGRASRAGGGAATRGIPIDADGTQRSGAVAGVVPLGPGSRGRAGCRATAVRPGESPGREGGTSVMGGSRYEVFDRSRLKLKPLSERRNDLQLERWIGLEDATLPYAHPDLALVVDRVI